MLRLERPIVPADHEVDHVVEEAPVPVDARRISHRLGHQEVEIPILGMPEDHRVVIVVAAEEPLQLHGGVGETFDREGNILEEEGGAARAPAADITVLPHTAASISTTASSGCHCRVQSS
jgi:hypothetical protein